MVAFQLMSGSTSRKVAQVVDTQTYRRLHIQNNVTKYLFIFIQNLLKYVADLKMCNFSEMAWIQNKKNFSTTNFVTFYMLHSITRYQCFGKIYLFHKKNMWRFIFKKIKMNDCKLADVVCPLILKMLFWKINTLKVLI